MPSETDLCVIRQFIASLDDFARHDAQWDRILLNRHTGGAALVSPTFAGDIQVFSKHWYEEAAPMRKAIEDGRQAMIQLAQRYRVTGGAFALLIPHKADGRKEAREAAERLADEICARDAGSDGKPESPEPAEKPDPVATHSADFTFVNWHGAGYMFALGVQSSAVKALWDEWEKTGLGLHQETIRNAVDPERDNFRMDKAFRNHPALGTMIQGTGDGKYKLTPPTKRESETSAKAKKSARIPPKARRKPR